MQRGSHLSQRDRRLDLLAAHIAGLDPETRRARERLEDALGGPLATLLVEALGRGSAPSPLARTHLVAVAA